MKVERNKRGQFAAGSQHLVRHNMVRSKVYGVWASMKTRCLNPNAPAYPDYGGRGILVCERWMDFANFLEDMGEPARGQTLDRIDNDGPYSPENCRWASRVEQARNKRSTRTLAIRGRTLSISEWAEISGVGLQTICARLYRGWEPERAVFEALHPTKWDGARHGVAWSEPERDAA